ncbi:MAG TPA: glycosyltransferase family 9 protein [Deltaproteobacteria bacterium]|nr:glycosyltransferase family 9 protein [Deltaproteobacteria bacterium]HOM30257.1 glycosyltransferase family 9 protein [Deltaproteobacteria bacterium]HPP81105.1 glycosyltransferase family 9 protein [Deltaproteobacteria bacterium]
MRTERVCVIHLNQIGDLIFSLPLLKALRDHYEGACIHSVARPYLAGLLRDSPYVDRVLARGQTLWSRLSLVLALRRERYDLLLTLARSEEALMLACLSGAKVKAGFAHSPWDACLDVKETVEGHNSWRNNARLLDRLGIPVFKNDYVGLLRVDGVPAVEGLPWRYAVFSPGASRRRLAKAWDEGKFARLIAALSMEFGLSCVLVGGSDTAACTAQIASEASRLLSGGVSQIVDTSGRLDLRSLVAVLRKAKLFVGIDSGVMHMASALDIPTVAIFGPTDPAFVGPQNAHSAVVRKQLHCSPCYLRTDCAHRRCLEEIEVEDVMRACRQVLSGLAV